MAQAPRYDDPAMQQQRHLGGGLIEFLFGGFAPPPRREVYEPALATAPPPVASVPVQPLIQHAYAPPAPAVRPAPPQIDPRFLPRTIDYHGTEKPGTIIINTRERFLYLVLEGGEARRYGIGVGRPGFTWAGVHKVTAKREWPDWRPPDEMLKRRPDLPHFVAGGPDNPLGARAMYLGSTLYRIHGSNEPWTIGRAVSSGCIRMRNEDVIDLYERVSIGTKVLVI
jgi:lipoprotein-anchoring transpeptidase ErfK/SrfK